VGRRHLSRLGATVALLLAAAASTAAASSITWRVIAHGAASTEVSPADGTYALVATSRPAAGAIAARVTAGAAAKARAVNFHTSVLVGVFAPFGCKDDRVRVNRIEESGRTLLVRLTMSPLPPGTMECQAIFPTFRLLTVPRAALPRVPTRATAVVVKP